MIEPTIGAKFGRLAVASDAVSMNGRRWRCLCECGNEVMANITDLNKRTASGNGCIKCPKSHGMGKSNNPTYSKYQAMRQRCENPNHKSYPAYGGRGIKVCERWQKFENFLADMGECPEGMTIERDDNDLGYEPGNCRWATMEEQGSNRRTNRKVEIDGMTFETLKLAADHFGISYRVVIGRISRGHSVEVALKAPLVKGFKGKGL